MLSEHDQAGGRDVDGSFHGEPGDGLGGGGGEWFAFLDGQERCLVADDLVVRWRRSDPYASSTEQQGGTRVIVERLAVVIGGALWLTMSFSPAMAQEGATGDGLALAIDASYEARHEDGSVAVTLSVAATNTLADTTDEFGVTRFYFDELILVVPVEATDIEAAGADGPLEISATPRDVGGVAELSILLSPRLYSGQTRELTVTFVLAGGPPRSETELRVNPAFAWFYVWAYGDPGASSVSVVLDRRFEVEILGDRMERSVDELGRHLFLATGIADPDAWVAVVSARDDSALERRPVAIGDAVVTLHSWPGDDEWATSVEKVLSDGIPALEELTGLEWDENLSVIQSFGPQVHGCAGWYVEGLDEIEIGEDLDAHLVLHEVSHAWFDDNLFAHRWIAEGLADAYAALAVERIGAAGWPEPSVLATGLGNQPLNEWTDPTFDQRTTDRAEDFGYAAAFQLIDRLIDQIGPDGMAQVIAAARDNIVAYRGEGTPEEVNPTDDWRRFLDLLEEIGGATGAADLFAEWVVGEDDLDSLAEREEVRHRYRSLQSVAEGWALPLDLRRAMNDWEFATAAAGIEDAQLVFDARRLLGAAIVDAGVAPPSVEQRFEEGGDAEMLAAEMAAQTTVLETVSEARRSVERPRTLLEVIGLWGSDPEGRLETAVGAVGSGDLEAARDGATLVESSIAVASNGGLVRIGVAALVVIALALLVWITRRGRRVGMRADEPVETPAP